MTGTLLLLAALQITPELTQHINAGLAAKQRSDWTTAIREFRRVVELAPQLPAAHVNLGAVYLAARDYGEAVSALRKAVDLQDNLPGAHGMLGTALLSQGFAAEAIPHLEKGEIQDLLGVALLEGGRPREAMDRLEAALSERKDDPDLLYYLARAHDRLARQLAEKLIRMDPPPARAHQVRGEALAEAGRSAEAEKHFRAALAARADLRGVHHALGELYLASGDHERAEAEFRAEVGQTPGSAASAYRLGYVLAQRGRTSEAIAELRKANELQPNMPETLLELGKALNASGDPAAAETVLRQLLNIEGDDTLAAAAHFQLAQVYRRLGRGAEADRELKLFQQLRR